MGVNGSPGEEYPDEASSSQNPSTTLASSAEALSAATAAAAAFVDFQATIELIQQQINDQAQIAIDQLNADQITQDVANLKTELSWIRSIVLLIQGMFDTIFRPAGN